MHSLLHTVLSFRETICFVKLPRSHYVNNIQTSCPSKIHPDFSYCIHSKKDHKTRYHRSTVQAKKIVFMISYDYLLNEKCSFGCKGHFEKIHRPSKIPFFYNVLAVGEGSLHTIFLPWEFTTRSMGNHFVIV